MTHSAFYIARVGRTTWNDLKLYRGHDFRPPWFAEGKHTCCNHGEHAEFAQDLGAGQVRILISASESSDNSDWNQRAILDMKNQRDKLHQYQRRITVLTDREKAIAKEMLAKGNKQGALLALRRKKYQESLLSRTDTQLEQLEKLASSVEFALVQKDIVFGLQQGTKVLQEIHKEMGGLEHVEKLMGETADAIAYQQVCVPCFAGLWRSMPLTFSRR